MANHHYENLATEQRKEVQRLLPRVLLFALLLLMSHVLEIEPSNIDAGGVKLAVRDISVIRGGLALVFYFYFWSMMMASLEASLLLPLRRHKRFARSLLESQRRMAQHEARKGAAMPSPMKIKKTVRDGLLFFSLTKLPFYAACTAIMLVAFAAGVSDVWFFGSFLWEASR